MLPLGGYVKMLDIREQGDVPIPKEDLSREFCRQSVWKRIVIVAAGPVANFLLAIILYAGLFLHGIPEPIAKSGSHQTIPPPMKQVCVMVTGL